MLVKAGGSNTPLVERQRQAWLGQMLHISHIEPGAEMASWRFLRARDRDDSGASALVSTRWEVRGAVRFWSSSRSRLGWRDAG